MSGEARRRHRVSESPSLSGGGERARGGERGLPPELLARLREEARADARAEAAREVHDELGQELTALRLDLAWLAHDLPADPLLARSALAAATTRVDAAIGAVRRLSRALRAPERGPSLPDAVRRHTRDFERTTGTAVRLASGPDDGIETEGKLAHDVARILQEALTNVARHAGARHVDVRLDRRPGRLVLEVADDGRGFGKSSREGGPADGLGLLGMRERALAHGGELTVRSSAGRGTTVTLRVPIGRRGAERKLP